MNAIYYGGERFGASGGGFGMAPDVYDPGGVVQAAGGILDVVYPVGSYYMSAVEANPADLFGFGIWERVKGRFVAGYDEEDAAFSLADGGEKVHTLKVSEMPVHTHTQDSKTLYDRNRSGWNALSPVEGAQWRNDIAGINTLAAGGGLAHNNLPPYETAYIWKRTE